jgi:hypothetical protein
VFRAVCLAETVPVRIRELSDALPKRYAVFIFDRDIFFIFESGEAINADHDDRVHSTAVSPPSTPE